MSKRERRDDRRGSERRDSQPEEEQQRRSGESDIQEGESLTALKAILSKVASLLKPLQLNADESIRLVEQLYGTVLEMDLELAGETDDTRKSSVLTLIQETTITRQGDRIVVEFSKSRPSEPQAAGEGAEAGRQPQPPARPEMTPAGAARSAGGDGAGSAQGVSEPAADRRPSEETFHRPRREGPPPRRPPRPMPRETGDVEPSPSGEDQPESD